mmetsp:Transcript_86239/g.136114  ORF Transcript_86239/g.136114 Transcript_86239/m.136114 type:complete len:125 (+) Transcript_86239:50-424(+)
MSMMSGPTWKVQLSIEQRSSSKKHSHTFQVRIFAINHALSVHQVSGEEAAENETGLAPVPTDLHLYYHCLTPTAKDLLIHGQTHHTHSPNPSQKHSRRMSWLPPLRVERFQYFSNLPKPSSWRR